MLLQKEQFSRIRVALSGVWHFLCAVRLGLITLPHGFSGGMEGMPGSCEALSPQWRPGFLLDVGVEIVDMLDLLE